MDPKKKLNKHNNTGTPPGNKRGRRDVFLYVAGIIVFTFVLYGNTLHHSYALDDNIVSKGNSFVQKGFGGIGDIFSKGSLAGFNNINEGAYRPVPLLTMAVETGIWGENPGTHHFFNVLYYAIACVLLLFLLKRMFSGISPLFPLLMVLLFIAHPIHTEAVANFKSRDEVLNLLFLAVMLLTLLLFTDTGKWLYYAGSLCFLFLALLSKEQAIAFSVLVPLSLWFFTATPWKKILLLTVPFLAVSIVYLLLRGAVLDVFTFSDKLTFENNALVAATTLADRLATTVLIFGKYFLLLVFPHPLSFDYSYNQIPIVHFTNGWVILTLVFFIVWGVYSVIAFRKKSPYCFSFFFFMITMSVVSNFVILIGSTLGERFLLIPSLAFCISLLFLAGKITQTDFRTATVKKMLPFLSVIALILILYSCKTITRNPDWKNNLSLFESDVQSAPNSMRTHSSLGFEYYSLTQTLQDPGQKAEFYNKAKREFIRSIEICPENQYALYNYGVMEYHFGKLENALDLYSRAVKVDSNDYNSWNDLSVITFQLARYDSSLRYFTKLLHFKPDDARVIEAIGVIHARRQEYGPAMECYKKALAIDPSQEMTYNNLIQVCSLQGDTAGARYYSGLKAKNIR